jgi:hypothetical protein
MESGLRLFKRLIDFAPPPALGEARRPRAEQARNRPCEIRTLCVPRRARQRLCSGWASSTVLPLCLGPSRASGYMPSFEGEQSHTGIARRGRRQRKPPCTGIETGSTLGRERAPGVELLQKARSARPDIRPRSSITGGPGAAPL